MLPDGSERKDEHGLSVASTPEAAARYVNAKGMIEIDLEKLPDIYKPLVPDPEDTEHFCIAGMPFENGDNLSDVLKHANAIRECSKVVT
jgi:hypothetical protein